jgi:3alpha(or 20beta)-hydroxysteroid dehydrogenase
MNAITGRLAGRAAIVTGAARGTGAATARRFVEEGARVLLGDVRDEEGRALAKELGDAALYEPLDVTSEADWARAAARAEDAFGRVDVLVNNAGALHVAALVDTDLAMFERLVRVNQIGPFLGIKAVVEPMKRAGRGSIVNISSVDGVMAHNGIAAYASTKWALRGLSKVAALELGKFGIRVNTVCPEAGNPQMIAPWVPAGVDLERVILAAQPRLATQRGRGSAERMRDIANLVLYLASDESLSCTGADFVIDGGSSAGAIHKFAPGA